MTNGEALDILERHIECDNDNCPEPGMSCSECPYNVDAIDYARARKMAIEALDKQCASSGAKLFDGHGVWLEPGELFLGENLVQKVLDQSAKNDEAIRKDDHQFREDTKKTDDVPDIRVGKTDFKPGDKFILELGQERRMFGEFEIKGTDLYVKTDLLEKLTRYEPEIIRCKDCKYSVDEYSEGDCYCRRPKKGIDYIGNWNFYCADAERRNDDSD